ncbi:MAG: hypothetical protein K0M50_02830 [Prolixibacteraceae bacterium]|nr:hypothetical protein [Prolixibacteraceae bacterium]
MAIDIKTLADSLTKKPPIANAEIQQIKEQVKPYAVDAPISKKENLIAKKRKEEKKEESKHPVVNGIINQILDFNNYSEANSVNIRLNEKARKQLALLSFCKISNQKFVAFAVEKLLENPEIQSKLKQIKNEME